MTDALPDDDDETGRIVLHRRHWIALVAVFAVIELAVLISFLN